MEGIRRVEKRGRNRNLIGGLRILMRKNPAVALTHSPLVAVPMQGRTIPGILPGAEYFDRGNDTGTRVNPSSDFLMLVMDQLVTRG